MEVDAHHLKFFQHTTFQKMVLFFIFGLICSIAHHAYYHSKNGNPVGSPGNQQWALRVGTLLAFIVHLSLCESARSAYDQWLWMKLKDQKLSVETLNPAFNADSSLGDLLNGRLFKESTGLSFIALIIHLLPIATVFAPATLSVYPGLNFENAIANVTKLDLSTVDLSLGINQPNKTAVWVSANGSNNGSEILTGPRTIIQRLTIATAATGEILSINPPFLNSTYQLSFDGPGVECGNASPQETQVINTQIEAQVSAQGATSITHEINYFAFVPGTVQSSRSMLQTNYGWPFPHMIMDQAVGIRKVGVSNTCAVSTSERLLGLQSDAIRILGIMWAFNNQIIGSIGLYSEKLANGSNGSPFSQIQTQIQDTILLGSSDLDVFFDREHIWTGGIPECNPIGQRQQDIGLARNEPLSILI
ncbi:hypothetical protein G7Y89_g11227 [Cudoniella acicularis]|uniref:Uncharacterized protein n=1 Tax=Cudoniella acicularis TaxID=354080 RepID=A0A8H4RB97_9HELO|nr:hypothetical protein G7Y89_g11227 [Cudoniella acicularis]